MFLAKLFDSKFIVSFSFFIRDRIIWVATSLGIVFNIFFWAWLYFKMPRGGESVPLHYNIYFGIDRIGRWYEIFLFPLTAFFILLVNFFLAYFIYKKEKFLSHSLVIVSCLVGLIILGAGLLILSIQ
ncbi:MAG: hypothetical protein PHD51_00225 [Patescibacteria group bacterium]|nr:hypothetical protein [Patescibacteria group bacterium]MDD5490705.1 hypothetical protein [Patescibacteria group bacterium]